MFSAPVSRGKGGLEKGRVPPGKGRYHRGSKRSVERAEDVSGSSELGPCVPGSIPALPLIAPTTFLPYGPNSSEPQFPYLWKR